MDFLLRAKRDVAAAKAFFRRAFKSRKESLCGGGHQGPTRMVYENYLQLQGRAGDRQLGDPRFGLSHNLGGVPFNGVSAITIVGRVNN